MSHISIIGGGIVGVFSAYYLNREGYEVTVFDQGDLQSGCSFGNAGMIVPSHIIPLAAPGMIGKGIRWMFNSQSPFYVKPRLSRDLLGWGFQFYKHATKDHVEQSIPAIKELSLLSKGLYRSLSRDLPFDFGFKENGLLMLYRTPAMEEEEIEASHVAMKAGIEAQVLSSAEVQRLEPDVRVTARGGVYYPGDAQVIPHTLMMNLVRYLTEKGVKFLTTTTITDFVVEKGSVKAMKARHGDVDMEYGVEEIVLAGGSWSGNIGAKLDLSLLMQAGKGYSFTLHDVPANTRVPSIFLEDRVAVTPMGSSLRFGGTMEIGGLNSDVNMSRVKGIVDAIPKYYPDINVSMPMQKDVWSGLRPCSPDGLPYIGRPKNLNNVVVATGHSMLGVSLAPGTGKLVSELIRNERVSMPIGPFNPDRYR
jgi:D-amino-acid dehydrogenase